jgi:hypothetical protein
MKTDSNYYDNTPLSSPAERLTLFIVMIGLVGFALWSYVFW